MSGAIFIVVGSGHFTNTVMRELVCLLRVGDRDYFLR